MTPSIIPPSLEVAAAGDWVLLHRHIRPGGLTRTPVRIARTTPTRLVLVDDEGREEAYYRSSGLLVGARSHYGAWNQPGRLAAATPDSLAAAVREQRRRRLLATLTGPAAQARLEALPDDLLEQVCRIVCHSQATGTESPPASDADGLR